MRMYQCWYCSKACSLSSHRVPMSVKCIYDVHSHQHSQARDSVRTTGEASHSKWELEWMRFAMSGLPWPHTAPSSMSSRTYFVFFSLCCSFIYRSRANSICTVVRSPHHYNDMSQLFWSQTWGREEVDGGPILYSRQLMRQLRIKIVCAVGFCSMDKYKCNWCAYLILGGKLQCAWRKEKNCIENMFDAFSDWILIEKGLTTRLIVVAHDFWGVIGKEGRMALSIVIHQLHKIFRKIHFKVKNFITEPIK